MRDRVDIRAAIDSGCRFVSDGGLETVLIFHQGRDLPLFATFPMVASEADRRVYEDYLAPYIDAAAGAGLGFVLGTLTWRASVGWGAQLGWSPAEIDAVNRDAAAWMVEFRDRLSHPAPVVVSGQIGPMGDAYAPDRVVSVDEAREYHGRQVAVLAATQVDLVSAYTMTHVEEAIGIARAATDHDVPCVLSFTVETDGRLPSGQPLLDAIAATDAATDSSPAYYMVNCAHPEHISLAVDPLHPALGRLRGIRGNASRCGHDELDDSVELDDGDPADFGRVVAQLRRSLPGLAVYGGCCGTDTRHLDAVIDALTSATTESP